MKVLESTTVAWPGSREEWEYRPSPTRQLSILVVDDDRDSADGVAMLLRNWNHDVRVAYEGTRALDLFRAQRPDLVLLDIDMPGMDGYELAARLGRERHRATLVALTGTTDRRRTLAAGLAEHFSKPVDLDALRGLIARVRRGRGPSFPGLDVAPLDGM